MGGQRKRELLARARFLLFPIQWEEPFGLVMTEALMCGTPVVADAMGAAPEIVKDGEVGVLVGKGEWNEMVAAIKERSVGRHRSLPLQGVRTRAFQRRGDGQRLRGGVREDPPRQSLGENLLR